MLKNLPLPEMFRFSMAAVGATVSVSGLLAQQTAPVSERPPNILFIFMDDMGWTDGGCFGSDLYRTPNIDKLRSQGKLFTQAYACAPICSPSRAGFMTGRHPARLGLTDVYSVSKERTPRYYPLIEPQLTPDIPLEEMMIPEMLKEKGYKSIQIGKWHLGGYKHPFYPKDQGFDEEYSVNKNPIEKGDYKGINAYTEKAIDFMRRNKEGPFFVYLAHLAPHHPYEAPEELIEAYAKRIKPGMNHSMPIYGATMELVDDSVGRLMEALEELGIADNTIVIFTSDNGGRVANVDYRPPTSNAPLRLGKHTLYEGGIRVPMIVRWPGHVPANSTDHEVTTNLDFFPTFAEIAGIGRASLPEVLDGISIADRIRGTPAKEGSDSSKERTLFWYYPHFNNGPTWGERTMPPNCRPVAAVRKGDWKLLEWLEDPKAVELYNLAEDPSEITNMAPFMPEKVAELREEMKQWEAYTQAAQLPPMPGYKKAKYGQPMPKEKTVK